MPDMSKLLYPERPPDTGQIALVAAAMRENVEAVDPSALGDRLREAEQMWRYFCRRDEMNAEVHLDGGGAGRWMGNVRYSPITIASERVVGYLARLYYGQNVEYRTAEVHAGMGASTKIGYTEHHAPVESDV